MVLKLVKFGEMLISRPAGREAYSSAKAYIFSGKDKKIVFDFEGVKVLTPSWITEFVGSLKVDFPEVKIEYLPSDNPTISASLKML